MVTDAAATSAAVPYAATARGSLRTKPPSRTSRTATGTGRYDYADAKDGWYLDAGGTYHYGAAAGLTIGRAELVGRAGWLRTEDYNDMTPPFYGSVGVGFGF